MDEYFRGPPRTAKREPRDTKNDDSSEGGAATAGRPSPQGQAGGLCSSRRGDRKVVGPHTSRSVKLPEQYTAKPDVVRKAAGVQRSAQRSKPPGGPTPLSPAPLLTTSFFAPQRGAPQLTGANHVGQRHPWTWIRSRRRSGTALCPYNRTAAQLEPRSRAKHSTRPPRFLQKRPRPSPGLAGDSTAARGKETASAARHSFFQLRRKTAGLVI